MSCSYIINLSCPGHDLTLSHNLILIFLLAETSTQICQATSMFTGDDPITKSWKLNGQLGDQQDDGVYCNTPVGKFLFSVSIK